MLVASPQVLASRMAPQLFGHECPYVVLPQWETGTRGRAPARFVALASAIERMREEVNALVAVVGTMMEIPVR